MKRLLQLGAVLLPVAAFFAPLAEFFDRWDSPGLNNDTEFPLYIVVLFICLVLIVAKLVSSRSLVFQFDFHSTLPPVTFALAGTAFAMSAPIQPHNRPPLRI